MSEQDDSDEKDANEAELQRWARDPVTAVIRKACEGARDTALADLLDVCAKTEDPKVAAAFWQYDTLNHVAAKILTGEIEP